MKYCIIIPDGAADEPLAELGGRTPLEAADIPNMNALAAEGQIGMAQTVPPGFESGSDVATMCLLGYAPAKYHTGRAPLEAAAQRIPLTASDWVFRCNLVTVREGIMKDHSAGGISNEDARVLLAELAEQVEKQLGIPGFQFYPGVSYRNLLVYRGLPLECGDMSPLLLGGRNTKTADQPAAVAISPAHTSQSGVMPPHSKGIDFNLKTKPPHEFPEEPETKYLPTGEGSDILRHIIDISKRVFANHPINLARRKAGVNEATQVWLWGQGHAPNMPKFAERFGVKSAAMITGVDLLRGLAVLLGWDVLEVPGMTSFHDTDYAGQGVATAAALDKCDLVFSHIEAPDEASHQADWKTKIAAIEQIDRHIVGPVLRKMRQFPQWRLLVMPDHPTLISNRKHGYGPAPFVMAGTGVERKPNGSYCEKNAAGGVKIEKGEELMGYFLGQRLPGKPIS